jgi:hypothetical protein
MRPTARTTASTRIRPGGIARIRWMILSGAIHVVACCVFAAAVLAEESRDGSPVSLSRTLRVDPARREPRRAPVPRELWLGGNPDPIRRSSLPFTAADAAIPAPGRWQVAATIGYYNLWSHSSEIPALHLSRGAARHLLTTDEIDQLERRYPDRPLYFLDAEGWIVNFRACCGLAHGLALGFDIPIMGIGMPGWDAIPEWYHHALGFSSQSRELFPRQDTRLYIHTAKGTIDRQTGVADWGIGDLSVFLSAPLARAFGGSQRLSIAAEAPTGSDGALLGSGGWDAGMRLFSSWEWTRRASMIGGGWTRLDRAGSLLGIRRSDTWHLAGEFHEILGGRTRALISVVGERSPLARFVGGALGRPGGYMRIGMERVIHERRVRFEVGQNWDKGGMGIAPDFSFHLTVGNAGESAGR